MYKDQRCIAQRVKIAAGCAMAIEIAAELRSQSRDSFDYQQLSDMAKYLEDISYDLKNEIASLAADESQRPGLENFKKLFDPSPIYVMPQDGTPKPTYPIVDDNDNDVFENDKKATPETVNDFLGVCSC